MKNLLNEQSPNQLHGRLLYSTNFANRQYLQGKRVLDVGFGFGWFLKHAINVDALSIDGVEKSYEDLKTATADPQIRQGANLAISNNILLPYLNKSFDVITCWDVLEHLPRNKELEFFAEIERLLADDGLFFLSTPNNSPISTYLDPAYWLIGHRHYRHSSLSAFAKKTGFIIEEVSVRGSWIELLAIYNLYIAKWIFRRKPFFDEIQSRYLDREWEKDSGFMTICLRMSKSTKTI